MPEATDDDYALPSMVEGAIEIWEWEDGCVSCAMHNISAQALMDAIAYLQDRLVEAQGNAPTLH